MGSVVSDLSGMPDQEGSAVTHPVLDVAVRATAESHSDQFHFPKSTSNSVIGSIDMVPQVLTSLSAVFFKALQRTFAASGVVQESLQLGGETVHS